MKMGSLLLSTLAVSICVLILKSEAQTEIGDYIVDCSACNSVPFRGVSSYSCKVRCEASGKFVQPVIKTL